MATLRGETPKKAFEVAVLGEHNDRIVTWGANFLDLVPDYEKACKEAKAASRKDGKRRWVSIRQVLIQQSF